MVEGLGTEGRENKCWYDVQDMVEGKEMEGKKDQLGTVEEEGNGVVFYF